MRRLSQLRTSEGIDERPHHDRLSLVATVEAKPVDPEPVPIRFRDSQIEMAHGAGGKASRRLVEGLFAPLLFGPSIGPLSDAAYVEIDGTKVAITTDSFVVKP